MLGSSRFGARSLASSFFGVGALLLVASAGTGCNDEPPDVQIARQAVGDLPCDGDVYIDPVADIFSGDDPEYCAYGCGHSQRYVCSDTTGYCRESWPNICP